MVTLRSGASKGGLRAAWEHRQQAAELAAAAVRLPGLTRSKPALLAAQLQPVLAALVQHAAAQDSGCSSSSSSSSSGGDDDSGSPLKEAAGSKQAAAEWLPQALAEAAQHLRRLQAVDKHTGPNTGLLLMLLMGLAQREGLLARHEADEGCSPAGCLLVELLASVGWERALIQALPLLPAQPRRQLQRCLVGVASRDASSSSFDQTVLPLLVLDLTEHAQQLVEELRHGSSNSPESLLHARGQLEHLELLQQLLLLCPAAAAQPTAAAALQRLQASAEACMAGVMGSLQQKGPEGRQQLQPLFQQLCQLRGRLMLSLALSSSTSGSEDEAGVLPADAAAVPAAHVWRQVLQMPANVAAAAAKARRAMAGCKPSCPTQQQLLAACVAATCVVQSMPTCVAHAAGKTGDASGRSTTCAALPGVLFELPPLPEGPALSCGHPPGGISTLGGSPQPGALADPPSLATAAERAGVALERDADCLAPAQLVLASLRLAARQGAPAGTPRPLQAAAQGAAWERLLELAAAAAADAADPSQQRHLLLALLHGCRPWQARLRQALATDEGLQQRCRRELVGVFNRLASDASQGGSVVVHGEERRQRTAAAVLALLPHALLCPAAVLERAVREAVVQAGEQVQLLLEVLREMWPLAALRDPRQPGASNDSDPLLLGMLADLLAPRGAAPQAPALDTPASQDAFLQLTAGLCGVPAGKGGSAASAAAPPVAAAVDALLSPAAVVQRVVSPALQQHSSQQGEEEEASRLLLPLQLADLLLGGDEGGQLLTQLRPMLGRLLNPAARRVDASPAALQPGALEAAELAAGIAQRVDGGASWNGVAAYFRRQLEPALHAQPLQQQLLALRKGMLRLLAALLPCCTAGEARQLLLQALPAAVQAALRPPVGRASPPPSAVLPGAHAAAMEAACRAARALGLQPGLAPIAGEAALSAGAAAAAGPPSALRQVAVERAVQHLTQHSMLLVAAAQPDEGNAAQRRPASLQLTPAERLALGLRCFSELSQLAAALQPAGYSCATLQAGLLQLGQQLLREAGAHGAPCTAQEVREKLAAAAAGLPPGQLRSVVLAAIERAGAAEEDEG